MARLPIPGSDDNDWGAILNDFLNISHNSDGSLQGNALRQAGAITKVNGVTPQNGSLSLSASDIGAYTLPSGGIPGSDLASGLQSSLNNSIQIGGDIGGTASNPLLVGIQGIDLNASTPADGQFLSYNGTSNQWLPVTASNSGVSNATASNYGLIRLDGDLSGTASSPTVVSTSLSTPLPINQGGTGSTTQSFIDLTTNQTIAGTKTFSNATITGALNTPSLKVTGGTPATGKVLTSDSSGNATWTTPSTGSQSLSGDSDVLISSPGNGQVLTYNSGASKWENVALPNSPVTSVAGKTGVVTIATTDLSDISITSLSNNQVLTYNSGASKWENQTLSQSLSGDSDVLISSPGNGQVLTYNSGASKWENVALPSVSNATPLAPGLVQLTGDIGNTATNPQVVSTHLTSALPVNQGGTGSITQNFVDLTTNQTIAGTKTFSGELIVPQPVNSADAATKSYVDAVAQGLDPKQSVAVATTSTLPANTYSNGSGGVGASLTGTSNGALVIDGYTVNTNDRILVQHETTAANNGIYVATNTGSSSSVYVLTRSSDFDTAAQIPGSYVFVVNGNLNADSGFVCTTAGSPTIGTTAINWTQFSSDSQLNAGTGLTKSGNVVSLTVPVAVSSGGTGSITQNFVDLTTNQTIAGNKTFSGTTATATLGATGLSTGALQVTGGTPATGKVLTSDSSGNATWTTPSTGSQSLSGDSDVLISSPGNGQVLTYNSGASKWENVALPNSPVTSVFGRTGTVIAQSGDYSANEVTGALVNTNNLSDVSSATSARGNLGAAQNLTTVSIVGSGASPYSAAAGSFVPVDISGGNVTITLPYQPANNTRLEVKIINAAGSNTATVSTGGSGDVFNRTGGATSETLTLLNQAITLQYNTGPGIWYIQNDDLALSQLDARYLAANGLSISGSPTTSGQALLSTSSSTANWRNITYTYSQTWAVGGYINVAQGDVDYINPLFVSSPSPQTLQLISCRYILHNDSSSSATVGIYQNSALLSQFSNINVTTAAGALTPSTPVTLNDGDMLQLVVASINNTPINMSFSIVLQVSI